MSRVFISSVISGFEEYRQAAKRAVELMDSEPVMSEEFKARSYPSEVACIHEVEQSDVYVLIMGEKYGFETSEGISVTQTEYRAAKEANRPILVFIQDTEMEEKEVSFKQEVEDFQEGFFRARFNSPDELKDELIGALRQLETMSQAVPEGEFNERVRAAIEETTQADRALADDDPAIVMAFLPQPERIIDIVSLEDELDEIFHVLGQTGIVKMRDGYKAIAEKNWTGIQSGKSNLAYFADSLILLRVNPTLSNESIFSGRFAPPVKVREIAIAFLELINHKSGYIHIGLINMEDAYVAPIPEGSSFSFKMMGDGEAGFNKLFTPLTKPSYKEWVEHCVRRFERIFKYK